ncbi:branched-chain-amino-acid aminotransferase-like protein 2 [Nematostella vectensis]|uniref:branched-chain-amino-acid aminotransferase-like protein 2 n=1 Tax=Nematostella vectensis TaxID=45351 RepID=UPI002077826C|nr:branched-chain-amino-acid aminotransferase-like protein 2 [Nematostella vectensis]
MSDTKRVILWTAPRCVSTAFERCMMNLKNLKAIHEPYSLPYYFGNERLSKRYISEDVIPAATYNSVGQLLQKEYDGVDCVFSKDMAYYVKGRFGIFLEDGFKDFQHTFLIRNPEKAVYSLYKASINPKLTGWDYFDPEEAGFLQLFELYNFVKKHVNPSPVVLDADDLLEAPDEIMQSYCETIGVDHEPGMTRWEPGPVDEWDVWAGWHENVLKSSGFQRTPGKKEASNCKAACKEEVPDDVARVIKQSMSGYEAMYAQRLLPKSTAKELIS